MLKFKVVEELKPNTEILELLENYSYPKYYKKMDSKIQELGCYFRRIIYYI